MSQLVECFESTFIVLKNVKGLENQLVYDTESGGTI